MALIIIFSVKISTVLSAGKRAGGHSQPTRKNHFANVIRARNKTHKAFVLHRNVEAASGDYRRNGTKKAEATVVGIRSEWGDLQEMSAIAGRTASADFRT